MQTLPSYGVFIYLSLFESSVFYVIFKRECLPLLAVQLYNLICRAIFFFFFKGNFLFVLNIFKCFYFKIVVCF